MGGNVTSAWQKMDEYLDTPFKFAYACTDGLVGKYRKKYYFGPVRITKKAVGVQFSAFLIKIRVEVGRTKKGAWTLASKVGFGLHALAELRLGGRIDTSGTIEPKATIRLFKRLKTVLSAGYNIKDRKTKPYGFKMRAPLYTHVAYNSKKGHTLGSCGALRNEKGEWETDQVKNFFKDMGLLLAGYITRGRIMRQKQPVSGLYKKRPNKSVMKKILSDDEYVATIHDDGWEDIPANDVDDDDDDNDEADTISDNNDIFKSIEDLDDSEDAPTTCFPWETANHIVDFFKYCWNSNFSLGDENINDI